MKGVLLFVILCLPVALRAKSVEDDRIWQMAIEYARRHPNPHAGTGYVDPEYGDLPEGDIILAPGEEWPPQKAYKGFELPTELVYLWRYLKHVYSTDAFKESCPADREIITHYDGKAATKAKVPARRSQLMGEERTFSIPPEVDTGNGYGE